MHKPTIPKTFIILGGTACSLIFGSCFAAAVFTTADTTTQPTGCQEHENANNIIVNCNNYDSKNDVYMTGGPSPGNSGLSAGTYYFTVIVPGSESTAAWLDGNAGNLSSPNDLYTNRTFTVDAAGAITYGGNHITTVVDSRNLIQLMPYNDTSNAGGVYTMIICPIAKATNGDTNRAGCKSDNFRVQTKNDDKPGFISGLKCYDKNTNGHCDPGEPLLADWPIQYVAGPISFQTVTDASGNFSVSVLPGSYVFSEILPVNPSPWIQTGPTPPSQAVIDTNTSGSASVTLNADKTYTVVIGSEDVISKLTFSNVCIGKSKGKCPKPPCYWTDELRVCDEDLAFLRKLPLKTRDCCDFDPQASCQLTTWLLKVDTKNMAYMLSVELATMELNVHYFISPNQLIYAPGTKSANANGFASLKSILKEAKDALNANGCTTKGNPYREYQRALKNALSHANHNDTFVQCDPSDCPPPVFPN